MNTPAKRSGFPHSRFIIACAVLLLLPLGLAAQTGQPPLRPVPMNPGPLGPAGYVVLLPLDDRPAVGPFAQMIGAVADHRVTMPPREMLGRFTVPGDTARIEQWLRAQDYAKVDALIVSVDMLAYGGLVASRTHAVPFEAARRRLEFFRWFKRTHPRVPIYAFNVLMRVAPTASAKSVGYHNQLARWAELKDRVTKTTDGELNAELNLLEKKLDPQIIADYLAARRRDLQLNLAMLDLVKEGAVDHLILLQDDARVYGLHRQDQAVLRERLKELKLEARVPIYNGTDEGSLSLVSRAVLDKFGHSLRVAVAYSSDKSKNVIAPYEDHLLQFTVESQIRAAGGVPVDECAPCDYTLFVNAPETTAAEFEQFAARLARNVNEGRATALADVLFPAPHHSGADERLIAVLKRERLIDRLVGYAAWNTAGNTLGTAIPHANLRVFFRRKLADLLERAARAEAAHLEFLLHRFAGDYLYHDIVRLEINRRLREEAKGLTATFEFTPEQHARVGSEVEQKLRALIEQFFAEQFQGHRHSLGVVNGRARAVTINGLMGLRIYLPWPRTFESVIEFKLDYSLD